MGTFTINPDFRPEDYEDDYDYEVKDMDTKPNLSPVLDNMPKGKKNPIIF